jgi:hypothetical protein
VLYTLLVSYRSTPDTVVMQIVLLDGFPRLG